MKIKPLHSWNLSQPAAIELQRRLAAGVLQVPCPTPFRKLAAADVSSTRASKILYATVIVVRLPDLDVIEERSAKLEAAFPYRTGLLSFREAPALLEAFRQLKAVPDAVMVDGQGIAHPREFGLACHLGMWLDLPTFGCAKSRLIGDHQFDDTASGSEVDLIWKGKIIGRVLRTRNRCRPGYVSVGHRISLEQAVQLTWMTTRCHRLPIPARIAHERVNAWRKRCSQPGEEHH